MATTVALVVKFLGKTISVNIIRDIKESYLVRKNPIHLCVGVSDKGFEWMFRKIADCNLHNKVLLELGTGVGFFLRNIYNEIPDNCLYIAVDHDFERQKF